MISNFRTRKPRRADREKALMLRLRFKLMLYVVCPSDQLLDSLRRLQTTIEAHINFYGPSAWAEQLFINQAGQYAGIWWAFNGEYGNYRLSVFNNNPFVVSTLGVRA